MELVPNLYKNIKGSENLIDLQELSKGISQHIQLKQDVWYLSKWKEKDCPFNVRHLDTDIEKYLLERELDRINNRNTTIYPLQEQVCPNVIHKVGMRASIDNDIGSGAQTTIDFMSVGTSNAAENVDHDDLTAEITGGGYARRQCSTTGTRTRTNETMKLGNSFNDTQVGATIPVTLKEVGIHRHVSNADVCHARAVMTDFNLNTGDLFSALMSELHENGVL